MTTVWTSGVSGRAAVDFLSDGRSRPGQAWLRRPRGAAGAFWVFGLLGSLATPRTRGDRWRGGLIAFGLACGIFSGVSLGQPTPPSPTAPVATPESPARNAGGADDSPARPADLPSDGPDVARAPGVPDVPRIPEGATVVPLPGGSLTIRAPSRRGRASGPFVLAPNDADLDDTLDDETARNAAARAVGASIIEQMSAGQHEPVIHYHGVDYLISRTRQSPDEAEDHLVRLVEDHITAQVFARTGSRAWTDRIDFGLGSLFDRQVATHDTVQIVEYAGLYRAFVGIREPILEREIRLRQQLHRLVATWLVGLTVLALLGVWTGHALLRRTLHPQHRSAVRNVAWVTTLFVLALMIAGFLVYSTLL